MTDRRPAVPPPPPSYYCERCGRFVRPLREIRAELAAAVMNMPGDAAEECARVYRNGPGIVAHIARELACVTGECEP